VKFGKLKSLSVYNIPFKMNNVIKMLASGVFMFYFGLFVALCHYSKSAIVIGLSYSIVILTSIGAVYALSQRETDFEIRE
jgi:hypothetical protein